MHWRIRGMSADVIKCVKCRGSNVVGYRGTYECMDCGHVFTLSESSKSLSIEEVKGYAGRTYIQKILHKIKDENLDVIESEFTHAEGIKYPALKDTGLSPQAAESALEDLSRSEILVKEVSGNIATCPVCNSHRLSMHSVCPVCGSFNLKKGQVLEHLTCGYVGFEKDFQRNGQLTCPKCRKSLKALGVDYKRQKNVYRCLDCGSLLPFPDRRYSCENNHIFKEEELILKNIYRYRVNPSSRSLIEQLTMDLRPIIVEGVKLGLHVRSPAIVKGKSGVEHEFLIAFWKGVRYTDSPDIIVEISLSDEPVDEMMVLALYAKIIDVGVKKAILAVTPGLNENARKLARIYGIEVVESRDFDKITDDIKKNLQHIIETLKLSGTY